MLDFDFVCYNRMEFPTAKAATEAGATEGAKEDASEKAEEDAQMEDAKNEKLDVNHEEAKKEEGAQQKEDAIEESKKEEGAQKKDAIDEKSKEIDATEKQGQEAGTAGGVTAHAKEDLSERIAEKDVVASAVKLFLETWTV